MLSIEGVQDDSDALSKLEGSVTGNGELLLPITDPNRPFLNKRPLKGQWLEGDSTIALPSGLISEEFDLLSLLNYSFFQLKLSTPLEPFSLRWLSFTVECKNVGVVSNSPVGKVSFHRIASPQDVRHTLDEQLEVGAVKARRDDSVESKFVIDLLAHLKSEIGIESDRQTEVEYYELLINAGNPKKRFILNTHVERNLQMMSTSPKLVKNQLIYQWKSGSSLRPNGFPWTGEGFVLHLTVLGE